MVSNVETIRTFVGFAEKAEVKTLAVENLEIWYNCYDHDDESMLRTLCASFQRKQHVRPHQVT